MSRPWATSLIVTFLLVETVLAQAPVRKFDDPGSPPFKVLKTGENPPLDADGNFVIGPEYTPAPERTAVEGIPQGKVNVVTTDLMRADAYIYCYVRRHPHPVRHRPG